MHRVLVLGSGKIGSLIAGLLAESGDYEVHLADSRPGAALEVATAHASPAIKPLELDATRRADLERYAIAATASRPSSPACRTTSTKAWPRRPAPPVATTST